MGIFLSSCVFDDFLLRLEWLEFTRWPVPPKVSPLALLQTIPRFFFSSNFAIDQLAKIRRHCKQDHLNMGKLAKFEGEILELTREYMLRKVAKFYRHLSGELLEKVKNFRQLL